MSGLKDTGREGRGISKGRGVISPTLGKWKGTGDYSPQPTEETLGTEGQAAVSSHVDQQGLSQTLI